MKTASALALVVVLGCGSGGDSIPPGATPDGGANEPAWKAGGPGCGLAAAAFCETFDSPTKAPGRAGELDPRRFSLGRMRPQLPTAGGSPIPIGAATVSGCRAGLPSLVSPPNDALVCDPTATIASPHLLMAVAAQNYGVSSHRIRQPFDFTDRSGTIVFDAEGTNVALLGWSSIEVTEDPIAVPSFSIYENFEGGVLPKNGVEVQLLASCPNGELGIEAIHEFRDYVDYVHEVSNPKCIATEKGKLHRFELRLSKSSVEISATAPSPDGKTFGPAVLLAQAKLDLPFQRGWVHLSVHNHATLKYSDGHAMDAWLARWDDVGFDGPVIDAYREYEIPDALGKGPEGTELGYLVPDVADGTLKLTFAGVELSDAKAATLAFTGWYLRDDVTKKAYGLRLRWNGGPWHDLPLSAAENAILSGSIALAGDRSGTTINQGGIGHTVDVSVSELRPGANVLELSAVNVPQSYPPAVLNVDLLVRVR